MVNQINYCNLHPVNSKKILYFNFTIILSDDLFPKNDKMDFVRSLLSDRKDVFYYMLGNANSSMNK